MSTDVSAPSDSREPLLLADEVRRAFGGVLAVDVDHFEVARGDVVALIGPNGAGKTTFFNVLTGFDRADHGRWSLAGKDLSGLPAYRIAREGMVRTFQLPRALARMTVLDNLKLAAPAHPGEHFAAALLPSAWRRAEHDAQTRAVDLLDWVGLADKRADYAGTLSGGQRKLLELGRALMAEPQLVMLDEPMAGVNPALRETILERINALRDEGLTVLFVEHDMDVVTSVSDRVVCMAEGSVIAEGKPTEVIRDPRVIDAYLGSHHDSAREAPR
jgi:neutral amino acid transport system ATP-binding protein